MMQAEREFFPLSIGYRGDMAFQNAEVIDVPKFLAGEIISHKELTSGELWGLLFERTESEMADFMRGLDHLERDELIQSAAEISAMQVCRRGLMAERKKLTRRNVLFLLQMEKPLGMISEVWMEQQNAEEGNAFSRLLAELYKQKGNGYLNNDEQPETVKRMLESCPNNCFMLLMPQGILKLASDEVEKALRGEEYTVLLDYSGDSEPIKTAGLLEMVVIDMRKDEQGCWYVLNSRKLDYPIFFDTEASGASNGSGRADGLGMEDRTKCAIAFCEEVKAQGYKPGVYASTLWYRKRVNLNSLKKYTIWNAHYGVASSPIGCALWQGTCTARLPGYKGDMDVNISYIG